MIYPVLTEFEWGIAGIIGIIILVCGIMYIIRENREEETTYHDCANDEEFNKYIEEETKKVHEFYDKVKADYEKKYGRPLGK